jgi:SOS-response transcriptional repressor LexA
MDKNIFGNRLKDLRQKCGLLQQDIAQKLNITKSAYGFYEQGKRQPTFEMVTFLADFFGVTLDYLLGRSDKTANEDDDFFEENLSILTPVPILGTIKAGPDGFLQEQHMGTIMTEKSILNYSPHFWLCVEGDSMINFSINDGDLVLIRKEQPVSSGKICAVAIEGNEVTLKRVKIEKDGMILKPEILTMRQDFFHQNK